MSGCMYTAQGELRCNGGQAQQQQQHQIQPAASGRLGGAAVEHFAFADKKCLETTVDSKTKKTVWKSADPSCPGARAAWNVPDAQPKAGVDYVGLYLPKH